MKQTLLIAILLLLIPNLALPVVALNGQTAKRKLELMRYWRPGSVVNVYFFRNMFTPEQRQVSLGALEYWEKSARAGPAVSFNYAGETEGLIDCHNCLTVARQETHAIARKGGASFNALRRNDTGELISAWIGIEHSTNDPVGLRGLIFDALGGVRGHSRSQRSAIGSDTIESAAEVRSGVHRADDTYLARNNNGSLVLQKTNFHKTVTTASGYAEAKRRNGFGPSRLI